MKKFYLSLLGIVISAVAVNAQSFSTSNAYVSGNAFVLEGHVTVHNNSSTAKDVLVVRTVNNVVPGHVSYFCWFDCYGETVNLAPDPITIPAMDDTSIFKAYCETNLISGITVAKYCFFDMNNMADSACVEFIFDATTGIEELPVGVNYVSKPYPNPANSYTNFYVNIVDPSKTATLKFFNMLGAEVKSVAVPADKNQLKVNVSGLKSGIYFYTLFIDGKSSFTGKLMVARN